MDGISSEDYRALLLSVGTHRQERRLAPAEVARLMKKLIDAGNTRRECAETLGIGSTQVAEFLRLLDLSPEIQHLADWGRGSGSGVPFSSLAKLSRLRHDDQIYAAEAITKYQMSWKEVVQLVQLVDRSGESARDACDAVLRLRPELETRHVFVGSITDPRLGKVLSGMIQLERDRLLQRALDRLVGSAEETKGKLGPDRFSLIGNRDPAASAGLEPDELEEAVNKLLWDEVQR
jgi:hypothetical protein